jgi:hypothetical protein
MSSNVAHPISAPQGVYQYPKSHWDELSRFVAGNERDPKDLFYLADDIWDAWPYAARGRPSEAKVYRFHFGHLHSFLKVYIKWYCYQRLIGSGKTLTSTLQQLPYHLTLADAYLVEHHITSLDEIVSPSVFAEVWNALLPAEEGEQVFRQQKAVKKQQATHLFWEYLCIQFGSPQSVPPIAPHEQRSPTASAADETKTIPFPVINQLVNKLGLHREGKDPLNRFHLLRLCVLVLTLTTGRRIDEVLTAPRGSGPEGPLIYYPAKGKGASPEGELWFQFSPNKNGSQDHVYISPQWRDITRYCVQTLLRYSDEIRDMAPPSEQGFLILVSSWNYTLGANASKLQAQQESEDITIMRDYHGHLYQQQAMQKRATGLSYDLLYKWLNGTKSAKRSFIGILKRWNITVNGLANGEIYQLRTHQARHTRQTALARDPKVSLVARQQDLNVTNLDTQFAYQHVLREQNEALLQKAHEGLLLGPAMTWLKELLGISYKNAKPESRFQQGQPSFLPERWRHLVATNPQFLQFNRVSCGY